VHAQLKNVSTLLIIGGGRWSRVYLSILARLNAQPHTVLVASRHGGPELETALEKANAAGQRRFARIADWRGASPDAAIILNASRDHAATACALSEQGIPALVEKPVAFSLSDAEALIAVARGKKVLIRTALVLRQCAYLHNFMTAVRESLGPLAEIDIQWRDASLETRYGERKTADAGVSLAEDVGPHIVSLLADIPDSTKPEIAEIDRGGLAVRLQGRHGAAALTIEMERDAPARQRKIAVRDIAGREAWLDFSVEPGTIAVGGISREADPGWNDRLSPLTLQLQEFMRLEPRHDDFDTILSTTRFAAAAAALVREKQRRWLSGNKPAPDEYRVVAMQELLAPGLISAGLVRAGDNKGLEAAARLALDGDAKLRQYL
jgi:predicted dehydrogenase